MKNQSRGLFYLISLEQVISCRNRSTVDYVITSVNILQDFDIHDFCNMLSDVHRPISCSTEQHKSKCENESQSYVKLWCSDKADELTLNSHKSL